MLPEGVFIRNPDKLFIGGEWVAPLSGDSIEIVNPNSEEVVARVGEAGKADMDRAVEAARQAFDHGPWPATPPAERGAALMRMAEALAPIEPAQAGRILGVLFDIASSGDELLARAGSPAARP